jgi:O-antigen biosynthesis protein
MGRVATEERFDPHADTGAPRSVLAAMRYEHLHRYALCLELAAGRDVLDVACGEGYGAALLGTRARSVVGVDLDPGAVERARAEYGAENVRFETGDCAVLPLADASADLVVSFETLEHTAAQDEMLAEIRRVLRPGGRLVISSPNKRVYSDERGHVNRHHVRELYREELVALLERHFPAVRLYGQRLGAASFVVPLGAAPEALTALTGAGARAERGAQEADRAAYFVAVCGEDDADARLESSFTDPHDDPLDALRAELEALRGELEALRGEHARAAVALAESRAEQARLRRAADAAARGIREQRERLDDQGRRMIALAQRWRRSTEGLVRLAELAAVLRDQAAQVAPVAPAAPAAHGALAAADRARAIQALLEVRDTLGDQLARAVFDAVEEGA